MSIHRSPAAEIPISCKIRQIMGTRRNPPPPPPRPNLSRYLIMLFIFKFPFVIEHRYWVLLTFHELNRYNMCLAMSVVYTLLY